MKIWCIDYGEFGVALIEGIDRAKKSQVTAFVEYVERPNAQSAEDASITFAEETGKGFYGQVAAAVEAGDDEPFFDFAKMPAGWQVPEASPLTGTRKTARPCWQLDLADTAIQVAV